jgi:glycosyltransferase involved in cell wall biosynthesis
VLRPEARMLVWENLRVGPAVADDLLFYPSYSRPIIVRGRTVVTTHDALSGLYPDLFPKADRLFYNHLYKWSAQQATLVLTTSQASRQDIARCWNVPMDKIRVVYLAPAECFRRCDDPSQATQIRQQYFGAQAPFFLFVGKMSGRRNISVLLEAFARFKKQTSAPHRLVLVGLNPHRLQVREQAIQLSISDALTICGYVPDSELNLLYNTAEALVIPSVYETASLPAMEAQAIGTPVICIGTAGMREITGGAALMVAELQPDLLGDALSEAAASKNLRERLVEGGLRNATRFSWQKAARETLDVLLEAARA